MAEYIDRKSLIDEFDRFGLGEHSFFERVFSDGVRTIIAGIPAADVAPVAHGRWGTGRFNLETGNYEEQCTRCRNFSKEYGKPYCSNCGARMEGGNENDR